MSRLSVPVEKELLDHLNRRVPWGLRHHLIRGLLRMALSGNCDILSIAAREGEGFVILDEGKKVAYESDRRVETG